MVEWILAGFVSDQGHGAETSQANTGVSQDLHTSYSFKGRLERPQMKEKVSHESRLLHFSVKV